jgi:TonB family protein
MAAGARTRIWNKPSRRGVPRYEVHAPLDVTMLRSGIPDTVPGRSLNLCERGLGAVVAGEMIPGDTVGVELRLPLAPEPLRTRALVRYQDQLRCGLEFVGLSAEQHAAIRTWAELSQSAAAPEEITEPAVVTGAGGDEKPDGSGPGEPPAPRKKRRAAWIVLLSLAALLAASAFWWKWNRTWEEIESGLPNHAASGILPEVQVPAEEMQKLLVHRVDPEYPAEARPERLQGVIVLDVMVGRDGSVVQARALNGPEVLAHAAVDAVRWWKFQPYLLQGKPAVVETTVAVEFKL